MGISMTEPRPIVIPLTHRPITATNRRRLHPFFKKQKGPEQSKTSIYQSNTKRPVIPKIEKSIVFDDSSPFNKLVSGLLKPLSKSPSHPRIVANKKGRLEHYTSVESIQHSSSVKNVFDGNNLRVNGTKLMGKKKNCSCPDGQNEGPKALEPQIVNRSSFQSPLDCNPQAQDMRIRMSLSLPQLPSGVTHKFPFIILEMPLRRNGFSIDSFTSSESEDENVDKK
uniref:Uncharacterized protein n=1 Tax=Coptotermes formosanus TaxID=36987 RepID=R4V386_COPFO|nr:hypothetical protein [Coptotermes formosanus]